MLCCEYIFCEKFLKQCVSLKQGLNQGFLIVSEVSVYNLLALQSQFQNSMLLFDLILRVL